MANTKPSNGSAVEDFSVKSRVTRSLGVYSRSIKEFPVRIASWAIS